MRKLPYLVLSTGLVVAISSWLGWRPCFERDLSACYDLLNTRPGDAFVTVGWVAALSLCACGLVPRYGRAGAAIGLVLSIPATPILDPGIPVAGLDSADGNPGTGIICGALISVAGIAYATLFEVDQRRREAGLTPLGTPSA